MANKRMFSVKVVDSDAFMDMKPTAQNLYFHLNMHADDDGFIDKARRIAKEIGSREEDIKELCDKGYLMFFDDGLYVITHWRINNNLGRERFHETVYKKEKGKLLLEDNGAYSFTSGEKIDDTALIENSKRLSRKQSEERLTRQNASMTQNDASRLDKTRLDKNRLEKNSIDKSSGVAKQHSAEKSAHSTQFVRPTIEEVTSYCKERNNHVDAERFIDFYTVRGWKLKGGITMKDWKAAVRLWERDNASNTPPWEEKKELSQQDREWMEYLNALPNMN